MSETSKPTMPKISGKQLGLGLGLDSALKSTSNQEHQPLSVSKVEKKRMNK